MTWISGLITMVIGSLLRIGFVGFWDPFLKWPKFMACKKLGFSPITTYPIPGSPSSKCWDANHHHAQRPNRLICHDSVNCILGGLGGINPRCRFLCSALMDV